MPTPYPPNLRTAAFARFAAACPHRGAPRFDPHLLTTTARCRLTTADCAVDACGLGQRWCDCGHRHESHGPAGCLVPACGCARTQPW